jgi:hypothetical protein
MFKRERGKILGVNLEERAARAVKRGLPAKAEDPAATHLPPAVRDLQAKVEEDPAARDLHRAVNQAAKVPAVKDLLQLASQQAAKDPAAKDLRRVVNHRLLRAVKGLLRPVGKDRTGKVLRARDLRQLAKGQRWNCPVVRGLLAGPAVKALVGKVGRVREAKVEKDPVVEGQEKALAVNLGIQALPLLQVLPVRLVRLALLAHLAPLVRLELVSLAQQDPPAHLVVEEVKALRGHQDLKDLRGHLARMVGWALLGLLDLKGHRVVRV